MKDFLLIANKNCITYKEFFPFIKDRIVNIGYTHPGDFDQPEEDTHKSMQGLTRWFTTLSTSGKPPLILTKTYDPEKYPKYDNYDAINVDSVKDIPWDYDGVIGCPITILDHNLDDVEIVNMSRYLTDSSGMTKEFVDEYYRQGNTGQICEGHPDLCFYDKNGTTVVPFMRVLIKKNFEIEGLSASAGYDPDIVGIPLTKPGDARCLIDGKNKYARILIKTNNPKRS